jgi:hypothetical protein
MPLAAGQSVKRRGRPDPRGRLADHEPIAAVVNRARNAFDAVFAQRVGERAGADRPRDRDAVAGEHAQPRAGPFVILRDRMRPWFVVSDNFKARSLVVSTTRIIVDCRPTGQESRSTARPAGPSVIGMTSIESLILDAADPTAASQFYATAFDLDTRVRPRAAPAPTSGFRGFTVSLVMSQPADVRTLVDAAVAAGATTLKPAAKSFWGFGGVVQAPDGTIWKIATSSKKDTGPATRRFEKMVLLIGVADVRAAKRFYVDHGLVVARGFGGKYVEFATPDSPIGFGLYGRRALAKDAGVSAEGCGSPGLTIAGDAGTFTDADGFAWTAVPAPQRP